MANVEHGGTAGNAFGAGAAESARARLRAIRIGLWVIAAVLAIRQVTVVLSTPKGERLTDLETWVGPNGVLHVKGSLYDSTQFTGTPSEDSSSNPSPAPPNRRSAGAGPSAVSRWSSCSAWSSHAPCPSR